MRVRAVKDRNIVFFGSYGKDADGKALKYDENMNSFSEEQQYICDDLYQKLSTIKGELWWAVEYGEPLHPQTTQDLINLFILGEIDKIKEVNEVIEFDSWIEKGKYHCHMILQSIYGNINFDYIL